MSLSLSRFCAGAVVLSYVIVTVLVAPGLCCQLCRDGHSLSLISLKLAQSWLSGRREDSHSRSVGSFKSDNDVCFESGFRTRYRSRISQVRYSCLRRPNAPTTMASRAIGEPHVRYSCLRRPNAPTTMASRAIGEPVPIAVRC